MALARPPTAMTAATTAVDVTAAKCAMTGATPAVMAAVTLWLAHQEYR